MGRYSTQRLHRALCRAPGFLLVPLGHRRPYQGPNRSFWNFDWLLCRVGSEPPHKAAVIPGAAELSVARVYIRCAPAHSNISVGTHISVGLHLGKLPGATPPCYSPHKSVGTRSGVVPGAPVGVLASWDVGAPRSDRQAVPEKRGTEAQQQDLRHVLAWQKSPFPVSPPEGSRCF